MEHKYYGVTVSAAEDPRLLQQPFLLADVLVELPEDKFKPLEELGKTSQWVEETRIVHEIVIDALHAEHVKPGMKAFNFIATHETNNPREITEHVRPTITHDGSKAWILRTSDPRAKG